MDSGGIETATWTDPSGRAEASADSRRDVEQQSHTWPTPPPEACLPCDVEMRCMGSAGNEGLGCECKMKGSPRWAQNPRSKVWHVVIWPHGGSGANKCHGCFRPCRRVSGRWELVSPSEIKQVSHMTAQGAADRAGWI